MHKSLLKLKHLIMAVKWILAILLCCSLSICANDVNLRIQHFSTDEGLAQNYVDCVYRDSRGFIWVGTWFGLSRFDGYSFVTYQPKANNENSISDGFINAIVEDKNGDLWIATRDGINKFIFDTEEFIHFKADASQPETTIPANWISSLIIDKYDNLWVGTESNGLAKVTLNKELSEIEKVQIFEIDFLDNKSISSANIYSLLEGRDGSIYVGSLLGLDKITPSTGIVTKYQDLSNPNFFKATVVHCLFEDNEGVLWLGTESGLLSIGHNNGFPKKYDIDRSGGTERNSHSLSHELVKSVNQDLYGNMLVGTLGGLNILDKSSGEITIFPVNTDIDHSLNSSFINDIYCDEYGNVWIGTAKGGLNKYNLHQKPFFYMHHTNDNEKSLSHNIVNSIGEDDHNIWIGTAGGGLNRYNKATKKISHYTYDLTDPTTISLDYISSIACDKSQSQVWLGTWGHGINQADLSSNSNTIDFKTHLFDRTSPESPNTYISSSINDRKGNLWVASPNGIVIYEAETKMFHTLDLDMAVGAPIKGIGCLLFDRDDNLWVGTTSGLRMMRMGNKQSVFEMAKPDTVFEFLHHPEDSTSLSGNFIVAILEDSTGSMWFSEYGHGISKLLSLSNDSQKAKFSHYTMADGLSNNVVYGMLEDNHDNLWLSTDEGLTKYNYIDKTTSTYYKSDGIQSNQFYWAAYYKNRDGVMYFGTTKGLNYFNPDSIKENEVLPRVVITDFKLFNKSQNVSKEKGSKLNKTISETSEIILKYNENIIAFEFSALSYFSSEKNMYRYMMEGFDEKWTTTDAKRRYVTYTNLNPGTYYFRVMGSNNDEVWNEIPTSIKLIITPPWWATLPFRVTVFLFFVGGIILIFRLRFRGLKRHKAELEALVLVRTKELKEKSVKLSKQTEELNITNKNLKSNNEAKDKLFTIVAHDLKNPFNAIMGMSELLMLNYDDFEDKDKRSMISTINQSSQNLFELLENLLEWARSQTGNINYQPEKILLEEILSKNIRLMQTQANAKGLSLSYNCPDDFLVLADVNLLSTIIRNLLNNAIKFTSKGAIVINVDVDKIDKICYIKVIDSGVGMSPEKLAGLFKVSGSDSSNGTKGETGTGLGLLVCKEFVEKNGGAISVDSIQGKGSSFIFTLPIYS